MLLVESMVELDVESEVEVEVASVEAIVLEVDGMAVTMQVLSLPPDYGFR